MSVWLQFESCWLRMAWRQRGEWRPLTCGRPWGYMVPAGRGVLSPAPSVAGRRFKAPKREETPLQSLKTRSASPPPPPCPSCCLFISLFLTELDFAVRVSPPSSRTSARLFLLYSPFSLSLLLWNSSSFNNPEITDSHFPPSRRLSHAWSKTQHPRPA